MSKSKNKRNGKPGWYEPRPRSELPAPRHREAAINGHRKAGRGLGGDRGNSGKPAKAEQVVALRTSGTARDTDKLIIGYDEKEARNKERKAGNGLPDDDVTGYCTICNQVVRGDDHDGHIRDQHPEHVGEAKYGHIDDEIDYFADEHLKETGKDTDVYKCKQCGATTDDPRAHIENVHGQEIEDAVEEHEDDEVRYLSETYIVTNTPAPADNTKWCKQCGADEAESGSEYCSECKYEMGEAEKPSWERNANQDQDVALAKAIDRNEETGAPIRVQRIHYQPGTEQVLDTEIMEYADEEEYYEDIADDPFSKDIILSEQQGLEKSRDWKSSDKTKVNIQDEKYTGAKVDTTGDGIEVEQKGGMKKQAKKTAKKNSLDTASKPVQDAGNLALENHSATSDKTVKVGMDGGIDAQSGNVKATKRYQ